MLSGDVTDAPTYLNALGFREILLKNRNITNFTFEDVPSVDYIDLSHNKLTDLTPRQLLPRIKGLILSHNQISHIPENISAQLPNIEVLVLSNNELGTNESIRFIKGLAKLTHLSIENNRLPENARLYAISLQPSLRFVNYERVTDEDRIKAKELVEKELDEPEPAKPSHLEQLSKEELLVKLTAAESLEELSAIEQLLKKE